MSQPYTANTILPQDRGTEDDNPHHAIFVVHGMGRQLEEFGNYERNVGYFVENTKAVLQSQFHELKADVHIIPIEWHAKLHQHTDPRMALASLKTVPKVRLVMNDYMADILYYFNRHFGNQIVKTIVQELNEAYATFMEKHPNFDGKIAVYALSLGGVAMYDILTCQDDDDLEENEAHDKAKNDINTPAPPPSRVATTTATDSTTMDSQEAASGSNRKEKIRKQSQEKFEVKIPKLAFRPHFLFTVGSPVGAVMVMRNLEWKPFHPPDDIIHHNLFHPFDPLGYRLEPLIDPIFAKVPPVTLRSFAGTALFPGLSLPTLPSLPSSLTSFWENNVPTLPRPSIPRSIPASISRWLPGGGGAGGASSSNISATTTPASTSLTSTTSPLAAAVAAAAVQEDEARRRRLRRRRRESSSSLLDSENDLDNDRQETHSDPGLLTELERDQKQFQMTENELDGQVSSSTAFAAAAAIAYMEDGESSNPVSSRLRSSSSNSGIMTSMTASPITPTRPGLGPRKISSRKTAEEEAEERRVIQQKLKAKQRRQQDGDGGDDVDMVEEEEPTTLPISEFEARVTETAAMGLKMEGLFDLSQDPSAERTEQEKLAGKGAKGAVIQEPMTKSSDTKDTFPTLNKVSGARSGGEDVEMEEEEEGGVGSATTKAENMRIEDVEDKDDDNDDDDTWATNASLPHHQLPQRKHHVYVNGNRTDVPYRIDHVLQETRVDQYTNEYLLSMRSHFKYWGNRDVALHILKNILADDISVSLGEQHFDVAADKVDGGESHTRTGSSEAGKEANVENNNGAMETGSPDQKLTKAPATTATTSTTAKGLSVSLGRATGKGTKMAMSKSENNTALGSSLAEYHQRSLGKSSSSLSSGGHGSSSSGGGNDKGAAPKRPRINLKDPELWKDSRKSSDSATLFQSSPFAPSTSNLGPST